MYNVSQQKKRKGACEPITAQTVYASFRALTARTLLQPFTMVVPIDAVSSCEFHPGKPCWTTTTPVCSC